MIERKKILIQCDFDGTITETDIGYKLLETFAAQDEWRRMLRDYQAEKISVGKFNTQAYASVTESRENLLRVVRREGKSVAGFSELVSYCRRRDIRLTIVSNGLEFYIRDIMDSIGINDIEVYASEASFQPGELRVRYVGPDGRVAEDGFKELYTDLFHEEGYRIVYIGNGASDLAPARKCEFIVATDELLRRCRKAAIPCIPFTDFHDVVNFLETIE